MMARLAPGTSLPIDSRRNLLNEHVVTTANSLLAGVLVAVA
jgi:hypothetical protein